MSSEFTTTLTAFVALIVAYSVAVERIVEIIKKLFPALNKINITNDKLESWRQGFLKVLAVLAGTFIAWQSKAQLVAIFPKVPAETFGWPAFFGLGFLASGGSGFWNNILGILRAAKVNRTIQARDALTQLNADGRAFGVTAKAKAQAVGKSA